MKWELPAHRHDKQLWIAALTLATAALMPLTPAAFSGTTSTHTTRILDELGEPPLHQYRAYRRMHAHSEKINQEGWMEAWTELEGRTFRYEIMSERGSDTVRNRVLRTLLKREQELI